MKVVNHSPTEKILTRGYGKFQFNWYRIILFVLFFPFIYFISKKYVKKFFKMNQNFQKDGLLEANKAINFNSFDTYFDDSIQKSLDHQNFIFTKDELSQAKEVTILNKNSQKISALVLTKKNSKKWVIGLHGWTENKYLALRQVLYFYRQGYNVLTFDAIAHGLSDGKYTGIGFYNAANLKDVIAWIKKSYDLTELGLIGNSMGASCLLKYLIDFDHENTNWSIFDCGFINLLTQMRYVMTYRYQKPWWLISHGLVKKYQKELGFNLKKYNLIKDLSKTKDFPLLIFHGQKDDFVPYFMSQKLYETRVKMDNHQNNISLISLPETNHVEAICKDNHLYQESIWQFLENIKEK